jgi:hypothetical protein
MQSRSFGQIAWLLVRVIFVLIGLLFLGRAGMDVLSKETLLRESIRVDGRIVAVEQRHRVQRNGYAYAPVFRFTLENGQPFTVESRVMSNPPEFKIGDAVTVYYKRDHPEWAVINSLGQLWRADLALTIVGAIFILFGGVLFRPRTGARRIVVRLDELSGEVDRGT